MCRNYFVFKNNQKMFNISRQIRYKGTFYDAKNTLYYWQPDFLLEMWFGIGYSISRKYRPILVSVLVLDLNQNSCFGPTLIIFKFQVLLVGILIWAKLIPTFIWEKIMESNLFINLDWNWMLWRSDLTIWALVSWWEELAIYC